MVSQLVALLHRNFMAPSHHASPPRPPSSYPPQDCVALYADKYDEEFEPFFATFVQDTWSLLSSASATR